MHQAQSMTSPVRGSRCAGTWTLTPRQAMTLRPAGDGVLRVACGAVWATFDGPHQGPANDRGDRLIEAGESLPVRSGERVVVEPAHAATPAHFTWDPLPALEPFGWRVPPLVMRLLLAVLASALTAGLWLGLAAQSAHHRADALASPTQPAHMRSSGAPA